MADEVALVGGVVATAGGFVEGAISIAEGRISSIGGAVAGSVVAVDGLTVAPGFVDLQVNGGGGVDLATEPGRLTDVAAMLPAFGVTSFLPTLVSSPRVRLDDALTVERRVPAGCAKVLGWHLEGPLLAPSRRGTHDLDALAHAEAIDTSGWSASAGVRLVTLAPELPGALGIVRRLAERGVTVSLGHSDADAATARAAIAAGASMVTHLFNAMAPLSHRAPGLVGVGLTDGRVACAVIADGVHVHPTVLDIAWRCAGPQRFVVVSDAMAAAGRGDGTYRLGDVDVAVADGVAHGPGGFLAGSVAMLDHGLRVLAAATSAPLRAVLPTVTSTPARVVGVDAGVIRPGAAADLVLLDADLRVVATLVDGVVAHDPSGLFGPTTEAGVSWRS